MPHLEEDRLQKLQISSQQNARGTMHQLVVQQDQCEMTSRTAKRNNESCGKRPEDSGG